MSLLQHLWERQMLQVQPYMGENGKSNIALYDGSTSSKAILSGYSKTLLEVHSGIAGYDAMVEPMRKRYHQAIDDYIAGRITWRDFQAIQKAKHI